MKGHFRGDSCERNVRDGRRPEARKRAARPPKLGASCGVHVGLSPGPNASHPEHMSAEERLNEATSLLAAGFLRHWAARAVDGGEKDLAILRTSSEVCDEPQSEGESL